MKDAYGNDMAADLTKAEELRKLLKKTVDPEERVSLIFRIRILEDDGR